MGATLIPVGIVFGGVAAALLVFISFWTPIAARLSKVGGQFRREIDLAALDVRPDAVGLTLLATAVTLWVALVMLTHPTLLVGALELLLTSGLVLFGTKVYLDVLVRRQIKRFGDQLENVLRMFAGAVRVGLGLRQALIHVAEQSDEPARRELTRVVGSTNLGVSIGDALDEMAARMTMQETQMLARLIKVQANTGSDLAGVLDGLADTIRDRRRFYRKLAGITSEGRATAWLLGILPLAVGTFIYVTQPLYRAVSFGTEFGRAGIAVALILDAAAVIALLRISRMKA